MKDGSQGYDVPFSEICEHGSLKRSCSVCIYQAELHEAKEQLNIAIAALEVIRTMLKNDDWDYQKYQIWKEAESAIDQIKAINGQKERK
jgi:hypothetical protein